MGNNGVFDIGTYALAVAAILVLTRPGSQGPGLVSAFTSGFTRIVQGSSGQAVTG